MMNCAKSYEVQALTTMSQKKGTGSLKVRLIVYLWWHYK